MKLTAKVKLVPTAEQYVSLKQTLERANEACNYISHIAWNAQIFRQFSVHGLVYRDVREQFILTAQMVIRCEAKVADAYKLDKKTQRVFRPHGAIAYDSRILKWKVATQTVSIWTLSGRQNIPFHAGDKQRALLCHQDGESDLVLVRGAFYLLATCTIPEPSAKEVEDYLGVDLGIANIATSSMGTRYSGSAVKSVRHRHRRLRKKLQQKGTRSAKRRLKKLSGKERRFAIDTNHCIAKRLVDTAERNRLGIALEDLTGIRERVRARRRQRAVLHSWAFADLGAKIVYKARQKGIPIVFVDPRNTSRTCPQCGHIAKANRPTQAFFQCIACGYSGHADVVAAGNIRRIAVNQSNVASRGFHDSVTSRLL